MKYVFLQIIIFLFAVSIAAQEKSVNEGIPQISISNIKWYHEKSLYIRTIQDNTQSDSPNRINNGSTMTVRKRNYFVYESKFKNETEKTIKSFSWDWIFLDKDTGKEAGRLEFSWIHSLKKNKRISTRGEEGPPTNLIDANKLDKNPTEAYNVKIQIKCVMFDDKSLWMRDGIGGKDCESLQKKIVEFEKMKREFPF